MSTSSSPRMMRRAGPPSERPKRSQSSWESLAIQWAAASRPASPDLGQTSPASPRLRRNSPPSDCSSSRKLSRAYPVWGCSWTPPISANAASVREIETAARAFGMRIGPRVDVGNPENLEGAFATIMKERAAAVFVVGGTMLYANRTRLADLAVNSRLPMMCSAEPFVVAGCLMGYSTNLADVFRRAATYVDKILKGAKPADLPIEQPTKFELVINLKTAKALGLTIPPSLLARTDQIIE